MQAVRQRTVYKAPLLRDLGRVERLTMGNNGSSWDGCWTYTQRGLGNDSFGPATGKGNPNPNGNGNGGGDSNGGGNGMKPCDIPRNYHPGPPGLLKK